MPRVIAWACRTPRRLLGVVVLPVLLLVVIGSIWSGQQGGEGSTTAADGPVAAMDARVPDATPFVTAAVRFVNVWGKLAPGQTPDQWHADVRALSTPDLGTMLDRTDPNRLVNASASGKPEVRFLAPTSALIAIPLTNGHSVLVTVVSNENQRWLVNDVQPDVGN
jgi:hypothetical protein